MSQHAMWTGRLVRVRVERVRVCSERRFARDGRRDGDGEPRGAWRPGGTVVGGSGDANMS